MTDKEDSIYDYACEDQLAPPRSEGTEEKSIIRELIKQLSPTQELYSLSMPAFVMRPVSLLEKLSTYAIPNFLIDDINLVQEPEVRMCKIVCWVLSNWRSVPSNTLQGSKPYNPVLGEVFHAKWDHDNDKSTTRYSAEQVCHKPPVSAFYSFNAKKQFSYYGYVEPKLGFHWNSVHSEFAGQFKIDLFKFNEKYILKLPHVYCTGIFMGSRNMEIWDLLTIYCGSTEIEAQIEFKGNAITGKVFKGKKIYFTLEGAPEKAIKVKDLEKKTEWVAYEANKVERTQILVEPLSKQADNESRKVWHGATKNIRSGDFGEATKQKNLVEEAQRKIAAQRKENGTEWRPTLFQNVNGHWEFKKQGHKRVASIAFLGEEHNLTKQEIHGLKEFFIRTTNKEVITEETELTNEEFEKVKVEVLRLLDERDQIETGVDIPGRKSSGKVNDLDENEKQLNRMGSLLASTSLKKSFSIQK